MTKHCTCLGYGADDCPVHGVDSREIEGLKKERDKYLAALKQIAGHPFDRDPECPRDLVSLLEIARAALR